MTPEEIINAFIAENERLRSENAELQGELVGLLLRNEQLTSELPR